MDQIQGQVKRVSRRLFWQSFLHRAVWWWVAALTLTILWFLIQPLLVREAADWLRWTVAGSLLGAGTLLALALSVWKAPSQVTAALSLDQAFNLRERITTCLTLHPEQAQSPAGQALLGDAEERVRSLDVGSKFPLHVTWHAGLIPACAVALALIAVFYNPQFSQAVASQEKQDQVKPEQRAAVDKKIDAMKKKIEKKEPEERPKSGLFKELEEKAEKIVNKPRDTKEQMRERVREMTSLTEQMKEQIRQREERASSVRQQLRDMNRSADSARSEQSKDGPAKDLNDALAKGDMAKAREEIDKLAKKMAKNELSDKDKEKLQQQLKDLQEKVDRAADLKDRQEKLDKANLDPETLKREQKILDEEKQKLKDLKDLAKQLQKCKECMDKGDMEQAAKDLEGAADKMKDIEMNEQELEELRDQLEQMEDAKGEMAKAGEKGKGDGEGGQDGGDGDGKDGNPGGRRQVGEQKPFKSFDAKQKGQFDPRGKKIFDGFTEGRNFKKKTKVEIVGEIEQAGQEAPEAIEQQRIPKSARDMAKGYFENLSGKPKDKGSDD